MYRTSSRGTVSSQPYSLICVEGHVKTLIHKSWHLLHHTQCVVDFTIKSTHPLPLSSPEWPRSWPATSITTSCYPMPPSPTSPANNHTIISRVLIFNALNMTYC